MQETMGKDEAGKALQRAGRSATASVTAQNNFTTALEIRGNFNFSLSGTWEATVTLQRSFDDGVTWLDDSEHTANLETYGLETESGVVYRAGVKTGDFTSGQVDIRISQ